MGKYISTTSGGGGGATTPAAASNPFSNTLTGDFLVNTGTTVLPQGADTGDLVPGKMHSTIEQSSAVSMVGDLASMSVPDLLALQDRLIQAGYMNKTDRSGIPDANTRLGFARLLDDTRRMNVQGVNVTPLDVLNRASDAAGMTSGTAPQYQTVLHQYSSTDPARIRLTAEAAFQAAVGKKGTKAQIDKFVNHFTNTELAAQKTGYDAQDAMTAQQIGGAMTGPFTPSGANPGIPDKDWALTQKIANKYGVDPRLLVAIGQHETGWGSQGDGRNGNVLGVGSYDSGSTYKWAGLQNQLTEGAKILSEHGVYTAQDVAQGKAKFWATDPQWAQGVLSAYARLDNTASQSMTLDGKTVGGTVGQRVEAMMAAAPGKITITSGTRSHAEQAQLYADYKAGKGNLAAAPGTSKHEQGLAADLHFSSPAVQKWAHDHAAQYGLTFPIAGEAWHVEPTGTASPVAGTPAISQAVTIPQPDLTAQATEYAQNADPVETQAYGIGQQFDNLISILKGGVI